MKPLSDANGKVIVKDIVGGRGFVRRLVDMGIVPGQILEVISNNSQIIVKSGDAKIALGRGVARKVFVEEVHE
ncbi:MAG: FeoA family protein [Archaeoglobaceae archaeon]